MLADEYQMKKMLGAGTGLLSCLILILFFQNCTGQFHTENQFLGSVLSSNNSQNNNDPDDPPAQSTATLQELETKAMDIVSSNCLACHGASNPLGGVQLSSSPSHLIQNGYVKAADVAGSMILQSMLNDRMPPTNKLTQVQKQAMQDWILCLGKGPICDLGQVDNLDLTFDFKISIDPLPFRLRESKLALIAGANTGSLLKLTTNKYFFGDYHFANGVVPKYSWEQNDIQNWVESVEPICTAIQPSYAWPAANQSFIMLALGREMNSSDTDVINQIQAMSTATAAEKFQIFCIATLSSLEFISK